MTTDAEREWLRKVRGKLTSQDAWMVLFLARLVDRTPADVHAAYDQARADVENAR